MLLRTSARVTAEFEAKTNCIEVQNLRIFTDALSITGFYLVGSQ